MKNQRWLMLAAALLAGGCSSSGGAGGLGGDGTAPESAPTCAVVHSTGLAMDVGASQTWTDCTPLGTHTAAEAIAACHAFRGGATDLKCLQFGCTVGATRSEVVCGMPTTGTGMSPCMGADPAKAYPCSSLDTLATAPDLVRAAAGMCGVCPFDGDPTWQ